MNDKKIDTAWLKNLQYKRAEAIAAHVLGELSLKAGVHPDTIEREERNRGLGLEDLQTRFIGSTIAAVEQIMDGRRSISPLLVKQKAICRLAAETNTGRSRLFDLYQLGAAAYDRDNPETAAIIADLNARQK